MTIRLTTAASLPLSLALLAGCDVQRSGGPLMNEAQEAADAGDSAGSAGEVKQPGTDDNRPPSPAEQVPDDARAQPPGQFGNSSPPGEQSGTHVGRKTNEVLNARELANDPNWTVAASDPSQVRAFSIPGTAYNRAAAFAGTANLEQWIKQEQALNGSYPSYQALKQYMEQNAVDMPALREYQHYGYDETTGEVVILENSQEKSARRNELGIAE